MLPDFDQMSSKELKNYAKDNNIDLGDAKKKDDILSIIKKYYNNEEDTNMLEEKNLMEQEMNAGNGEVDTNLPENTANTENTKANGKRVFHDAEGNEISMSQFIREKFIKDNMSRKEIADKFDINYRTVYGATVNMTNAAEPASRGRRVVNPKIKITADNKVLTVKVEGEGDAKVSKFFLNGEEISADEAAALETVETDRNTWIKEQVAAGMSRGDIAKMLDLSYGVVYGLTKEEGTRQKYEVELPDGTKMGRAEYIRKRVAEGVSKADVAKELGVEYSVVWQATKKDKTDAEKYEALIRSLEKLADKMNDKEGFMTAIEMLKTFAIVEEDKAGAASATDETAETNTEA